MSLRPIVQNANARTPFRILELETKVSVEFCLSSLIHQIFNIMMLALASDIIFLIIIKIAWSSVDMHFKG